MLKGTYKRSRQHKIRMSKKMMGENNGMFGKKNKWGKHTIKAKQKIGRKNSGESNGMFGKKHNVDWKKKMSKRVKGKNNPMYGIDGKKSPNWQGGKSFEPYGLKFNERLKEQIRKRDNHRCQECLHSQKWLGYKLPIHHIDYNKQNNNPNNLISLCKNCHGKTNFEREDWIKYFKIKVG